MGILRIITLITCIILTGYGQVYSFNMKQSGDNVQVSASQDQDTPQKTWIPDKVKCGFFMGIFIVGRILFRAQEHSLQTNPQYAGFFKADKRGYKYPESEQILAIQQSNPWLVAKFDKQRDILIGYWVGSRIGLLGMMHTLIHWAHKRLKTRNDKKVSPVQELA